MAPHSKPPESFRSVEQQATLCLLRTADAVKRRFAQVIDPHGITPQQYNVLRILRGAGPVGLPTLTIGERMIEQEIREIHDSGCHTGSRFSANARGPSS